MKTILLCEDSKVLSELLYETLKAHGYQVLTADNGYDALAKARNDHPDLILLDLMLPKIDGLKICRMLKFDKEYSHIPIIILTARSQPVEEEIGYSTGANFYLTKPFDGNELTAKVKELLKV